MHTACTARTADAARRRARDSRLYCWREGRKSKNPARCLCVCARAGLSTAATSKSRGCSPTKTTHGCACLCTRRATPVRTAPTAVCPAQIRVIDATAVERAAKRAGVKTQYRHHPRHAKSQMQARVRADGSFALAGEEGAEQQDDDGAEEPTTRHGGAAGEGAGGDAGSQQLAGGTTAAAKPTAAATAMHVALNASGAAAARAPNASTAGASQHSSHHDDASAAASATAASAASASAPSAASAAPPAAARPTPASPTLAAAPGWPWRSS